MSRLDARQRPKTHLDRALKTYVEHYNAKRPHRGLDLDVPAGAESTGTASSDLTSIRCRDVLGGLIHEYELAA